MSKLAGMVMDLIGLLSGVLLGRYLMRLSTPAKDWTEIKSVYRHVKSTVDFQLLKLHLPTRIHSVFGLDRILQLRMKVYFANGGYADDR